MDEVQAFIARNKHQFGYIMGEAAKQWAAIDPVGALTVGPCVKQVEVYGEFFKLADENEQYREALKEISQWDKMLYSPREMGNLAKKALGIPEVPLKE